MSCRIGLVLLCASTLGLFGCVSTAGPFVTDIQADAEGNLIIEKCLLQLDSYPDHSTVSTGTCRSFLLKLSTLKRAPAPVESAPAPAPDAAPAKADAELQTP